MHFVSVNQAGSIASGVSGNSHSINHAGTVYDYQHAQPLAKEVTQFPGDLSPYAGAGSLQNNQPYTGPPFDPHRMAPYPTPPGQGAYNYAATVDGLESTAPVTQPLKMPQPYVPSAPSQNPTVSRQQSHGRKRALDEERDEEAGSHQPPRKKPRKPYTRKDHSRPKKAPNMFLCFRMAHSRQIKAEKPGITNGEVSALLSERWRAMSDAEKQPWRARWMKLKTGEEQLTRIVWPRTSPSSPGVSTHEQDQPQEQLSTQQTVSPCTSPKPETPSETNTEHSQESLTSAVTTEERVEYDNGSLKPDFDSEDLQSPTHLTIGAVPGEMAQDGQDFSIDLGSFLTEDNAQFAQKFQFPMETVYNITSPKITSPKITSPKITSQEFLAEPAIVETKAEPQHIPETETSQSTADTPIDEHTLDSAECTNAKSVDDVKPSWDLDLPSNFIQESLDLDCGDPNLWFLDCQNSDSWEFNLSGL
ncbi:hypothetical protein F5Y01DRAFT_324746 [Xylaria sp. FL0043]|nr:hypothetical protein F5Y01DRAFT_324746 [Xylaria sp. FL0043]